MMMRDSKLLMPYYSPHLAAFPDGIQREADKTRCIGPRIESRWSSLGYNTNMIRAAAAPKSFAELVKPENRGKIAVSGDTTGCE